MDAAKSRSQVRIASPGDSDLLAGNYRLLGSLGAGSMCEVLEAEHVRLGTRVAVKLLRRELVEDARAIERFRREARALAGFSAENLVRVFDCAEDDEGRPFFVMERLCGEDLRRTLEREGSLSLRRALHVALDVCRGLAELHRAGLVHRDIKPANLFLTQDALGTEVCKILDLGVARIGSTHATRDGALIGTLRYMAPEQLVNSASVDRAADVYAVGAVLYECVTGRPPHEAESVEQLMFEILNREPPAPSTLRKGLSKELESLILQALARKPERRPGSVAQFAQQLKAIAAGSSLTSATTGPETLHDEPDARRQTVTGWMLSFAGLAIVVVLSIAWSWRVERPALSSQPVGRVQQNSAAPLRPLPNIDARIQNTSHGQGTSPNSSSAPSAAAAAPEASTSASNTVSAGARAKVLSPRSTQLKSSTPRARALTDFDRRNPYAD